MKNKPDPALLRTSYVSSKIKIPGDNTFNFTSKLLLTLKTIIFGLIFLALIQSYREMQKISYLNLCKTEKVFFGFYVVFIVFVDISRYADPHMSQAKRVV
jgi:hypothetical protein